MLDTITVQALINRYPTVCGMTGTALAAGEQLRQFYSSASRRYRRTRPTSARTRSDRVYITAAAKTDGIIDHIAEVHETSRPFLVGTRDVAESEELHDRCSPPAAETGSGRSAASFFPHSLGIFYAALTQFLVTAPTSTSTR